MPRYFYILINTNMKQINFLIVALLFAFTGYAQMPGMMPQGGGSVYGKITDADGKPLSDVSVLILENKMDTATKKMKAVLLKAVVTESNGDFRFEDLPLRSSFALNISSTGFGATQQNVSFAPKPGEAPSLSKDLGNIKLTPDAKELQTVTVTASAPAIKLSGEKKIFSVDKNIMSVGGTGVDVMRNVPSVNVDIDGNIKLRNAAPQLLVDGRPTTLTLDQIPADAIESVEVITNPSAKYDASGGGAGVLNIVLKKNKKTGYNGNVRAGVDKYGAINGGADISLRQNKFNFNASGFLNQNKSRTTGFTERENLTGTPLTNVFQNNYNRTKGQFMFGKVGLDYLASNRSTFSISGIKVHGQFNPNETISIRTDSLYNTGTVQNLSNRYTTGTRQFDGQGLVFGYKHLFMQPGEEITFDANYFGGKNSVNSLYTTDFLSQAKTIDSTGLQNVLGSGSDKNFTFQTDYKKPLSKLTTLETGLRANIRSRVNNNANYIFSNGNYVFVPNASSNYENTDNVYAAYVTVSSSIKDFSYNLGLRAESSNYTGKLISTGDQFQNKYPVSLFPSVFFSQKLKNKQELQLSYSRRINRPNFFQLIPFVDYTDKLNITTGNPALKPEFTQSTELSYLKTFSGRNTLLGSIYYKYTDNLITRYLTQGIDPLTGDDVLINSYINANSSYAAGAELTSANTLSKAWDISTNINAYNSKINSDNTGTASQAALWSWFGKFNSNFKLPANFAIQYTATYQSKTNLPINTSTGMGGPGFQQSQSASQGYIKSFWGMDLAVKKSFLKNNAASVSLSINDIFRTRITEQYSSSAFFTQTYSRLRDPQMVRLNFNYRFGKMDANLFKRKSAGATPAMETGF